MRISGSRRLAALLAIIAIAGALRFARLGENPPGVYCDEASIAYNAWTIATRGTDEFGVRFPLFFRSFGEYKNPVYVYADVPFVAALGMTPLAARLPAAIFGTATVLAAFLLAASWFGERAGFATAILLTVSPWHLAVSRLGFEAVAFPFFLSLGLLLFVDGVSQGRTARAVAGSALLALTPYCYAPAKLVVPLVVLAVIWIQRRSIRARGSRRRLAIALVPLTIAVLPLVWMRVVHRDFDRRMDAIGVGSLTDWSHSLARENVEKLPTPIAGAIEKSRAAKRVVSVFIGYFAHWNPRFLFLAGDPNLRHGTGRTGIFLPAEMLLFAAGLVSLRRRFRAEPRARLLSAWLLIAPAAPALTLEGLPHALRLLGAIPAAQMLCALGALEIAGALGSFPRRAIAAGWALSAAASLHSYFVLYPHESKGAFQHEAVPIIEAIRRYPGTICEIRTLDGFEKFYALWGFYTQAPPDEMHAMERLNRIRCHLNSPLAHLDILRDTHPFAQCRTLVRAHEENEPEGWVLQECAPDRTHSAGPKAQ